VDVLRSRGELQESLEVAERLISEHPQSLQGHIRRSRILILLGQPESALDLSAFSRNIAPHDPITHVNHGFILAALNRLEEALVFYDRALELKQVTTGPLLCWRLDDWKKVGAPTNVVTRAKTR
jgi:tetratricopeptide (TPR) repeat protein